MFAALRYTVVATLALTVARTALAETIDDSIRALAFDCYNNNFYVAQGSQAWYRNHPGDAARNTGFWTMAEMIEVAEDAYDRMPSDQRKAIVSALLQGFVGTHGEDWSSNKFNDDILWASIAFGRGKIITGNDYFGQVGSKNFNTVWYRAWSDDLGGGLWWNTDKGSKNSCVNGPGIIAATLYYSVNYGANYLTQARKIYDWQRKTLVHADTGMLDDSITKSGTVNAWHFSYNQGTWVGAGSLLYKSTGNATYKSDASKAIAWTRDHLTGQHVQGIINDEYNTGDGLNDAAGFKSIFARWMGKYISVTGDTQFNSWFKQNAQAAWQYRNTQGISWGQFWHRTTDSNNVTSWECADGASWIINSPN